MNLDLFVRLQNGSLVNTFKPNNIIDVDINEYADTILFKHVNTENVSHIDAFKNIILPNMNT